MVQKSSRRELLEGFAACSVIPMEPGLPKRNLVQALEDETELEREARMSEPYVCVDFNGLTYALYVGDSAITPLGVAIRRHFTTFSDFLWIERTSFGAQGGEAWSAVMVQDGLALDEVLNEPKSEIRRMVAEVAKPLSIITQHRSLLESWLPRAMQKGASAHWVDISVSPMSGASKLAKLEPLDEALRTAKLKSALSPKQTGLAAAAAALTLAMGWAFWPENVQPVSVINAAEVQKRLHRPWLANIIQKPRVDTTLKKAHNLLLEAWALGLRVDKLDLKSNPGGGAGITLSFGNVKFSNGHELLLQTWASARNLQVGSNSIKGIIASPPAYEVEEDGLQLRNLEDLLLFDQDAIASVVSSYNYGSRPAVSTSASPMQANPYRVQQASFDIQTADNLTALLILAEDSRLQDTFLEKLTLSVNHSNWSATSSIELTLGGWVQPGS